MTNEELLNRRISRLENLVGDITESLGELESKMDDISDNVAMLAVRVDIMRRARSDGQRALMYVWIVAGFAAITSGACLGMLWK
jgi:hypothetical protein